MWSTGDVTSHRRAFAAALIGVQHDEKEIYRVIGPAGIQDWGDGEAQEILAAHAAMPAALDAVALRKSRQRCARRAGG